MARYRKKPVVIEAMRWCGPEDDWALTNFLGSWRWCHNSEGLPCIATLESGAGLHVVEPGCWVVKGVMGEFYSVRADIFAATYDPEPESESGDGA